MDKNNNVWYNMCKEHFMLKKSIVLLFAFMVIGLVAVSAQSTSGWPPANILKEFGIEGMPVPAGATDITWRGDWEQMSSPARNMTDGNPALRIGFRGTNATGNAIKAWFEGNGWKEIEYYSFGATAVYIKGDSCAYYTYSAENTGQIIAGIMGEDFKWELEGEE